MWGSGFAKKRELHATPDRNRQIWFSPHCFLILFWMKKIKLLVVEPTHHSPPPLPRLSQLLLCSSWQMAMNSLVPLWFPSIWMGTGEACCPEPATDTDNKSSCSPKGKKKGGLTTENFLGSLHPAPAAHREKSCPLSPHPLPLQLPRGLIRCWPSSSTVQEAGPCHWDLADSWLSTPWGGEAEGWWHWFLPQGNVSSARTERSPPLGSIRLDGQGKQA